MHRLEAVCPSRYSRLVSAASGDEAMVRQLVEQLAALTVEAAQVAFKAGYFGAGARRAPQVAAVLSAVAESLPRDIARRRLDESANAAGTVAANVGIGFPAAIAENWARRADRGYTQARRRADVKAAGRYDTVRAGRGDELLNVYGSAELDAAAFEAITLWTADPLPLADIEYAARMATGDTR